MKQQILRIIVFCAAGLVFGAQAQSSGSSSGSSGSSSSSGSGLSGWMGRHLGATGRMEHHDLKASQLNGSEIKSSSGQALGTISDVIVNPSSGRMDFAIVSLSPSSTSSGAATSPSGSSSGTSSSSQEQSSTSPSASASSSSSGGKEVAVPWMLLRPSTAATGGQQPSFTFIGDPNKLESAPTFEPNTDVSQSSWRQSIYSYYGLSQQQGGATGGAESPSGSSGGSSEGSSGSSQSPSSSGNQ